MVKSKPGIIVLSSEDDDVFRWLSDGWFQMSQRRTEEAMVLFAKVDECVRRAENHQQARELLEEAGFAVLGPDLLSDPNH